eukprot:TRINITY_DN5804_c0_g1_i3.p1 TRINITY_DN5804_c0_g1~~TRINITY_DN5804_c0_g1_i3.p1  ORF type:complete len:159 (+),score=18.04 TRINITY_DN5804_c0_g1_i3:208-684(+)
MLFQEIINSNETTSNSHHNSLIFSLNVDFSAIEQVNALTLPYEESTKFCVTTIYILGKTSVSRIIFGWVVDSTLIFGFLQEASQCTNLVVLLSKRSLECDDELLKVEVLFVLADDKLCANIQLIPQCILLLLQCPQLLIRCLKLMSDVIFHNKNLFQS